LYILAANFIFFDTLKEFLLLNHMYLLIIALVFLIFVSSFFSGSETGMMALNRYRLRHLASKKGPKNRVAKRVSRLLERPDRLLGIILIGNTFATILVSAIATLLAINLFGDIAVFPASIIIALLMLIFAEVIPKTLAAFYPERLAFAASGLLSILLKLLYPLVLCVNMISNGLLRLWGVNVKEKTLEDLTSDEVRTIVYESTSQISLGYKRMMLGVLDLARMTVDDVKVPRSDIVGIDLDDPWEKILQQLSTAQHTRLPVFTESIDKVQGILHLRKALNLASQGKLNKNNLLKICEEVYFIPEGTALNVQVVNFRQEKCRIGLIVDEYGDIQGLVTLEDILEEIVGEFTTNLSDSYKTIQVQRDGSYLVDGSVSVRELNRRLQLELSIDGPKTLSGLIVEYLEAIPSSNIGLRVDGYPMEVVQVEENTVKLVRIWPDLKLK